MLVAIDPGRSGYAVILSQSGEILESTKLPITKTPKSLKRVRSRKTGRLKPIQYSYDLGAREMQAWLIEMIGKHDVKLAVVEKSQPMQRDSAMTAFKIGTFFGRLLTTIENVGIDAALIAPVTWQKRMLPVGEGSSKDRAKLKFLELYPEKISQQKIDDGLIDAVLLGRYAINLGRAYSVLA